jgi:hypothetical protein
MGPGVKPRDDSGVCSGIVRSPGYFTAMQVQGALFSTLCETLPR